VSNGKPLPCKVIQRLDEMGTNRAVRDAVEAELDFDPLVDSTARASEWPR
jgi:hypothetical protein